MQLHKLMARHKMHLVLSILNTMIFNKIYIHPLSTSSSHQCFQPFKFFYNVKSFRIQQNTNSICSVDGVKYSNNKTIQFIIFLWKSAVDQTE